MSRISWIVLAFMGAIAVGILVRFWMLGQVPAGLTWDEAAIGYNGFSIATVHRDEWLQFLPVSFRSFGDYKAPFAIYVSGFFTMFTGLTPWGIRLPFALAGVASILGMALLTYEWGLSQKKSGAAVWAVVAGWIVATTPWSIHFSRIAFESGIALCVIIWSSWMYLRAMRATVGWWRWGWFLLAVGLDVVSLYTYHSVKIFLPLFGLIFVALYWPWCKKHWRGVLVSGVMGAVLCLPLAYDIFKGQGAERLRQTSVFTQTSTLTSNVPVTIIQNWVQHLDPRFLFLGQTPTLRHGDGVWGIFLWPIAPLLLTGVIVTFRRRTRPDLLALGWFLLGLLPAAIGYEIPHANRTLLALPGAVLLIIVGSEWWWQWIRSWKNDHVAYGTHNEKGAFSRSLVGTWILIYALCFCVYTHHYFTAFKQESGQDFVAGYWEALQVVQQYPNIGKVRISNSYGQPYIYVLLARKMSPIVYQQGGLANYDFVDEVNDSDSFRPNTIVIGPPNQLSPNTPNAHLIYGPDQKVRFVMIIND